MSIAGLPRGGISPEYGMDAGSWIAVIPDAAIVVNTEGAIVAANSQAALLFGHSVEALLSLSVDDLIPESIRPRHRGHRARYNESPRQRPMAPGRTLSALRADETVITVEIALGPVGEGETIAIVRELSSRRQQEHAATQERLIALQDQVITLLQERLNVDRQ